MRIGDVARAAGVRTGTLRFYEAQGLVAPGSRLTNNYRDYPPDTVARVRFVRRAQALGFTLEEIRDFLKASDGRAVAGPRLAALAHAKLEDLERRVADLRRVQRAIRRVLRTGGGDGPCPIIEALACAPAQGAR